MTQLSEIEAHAKIHALAREKLACLVGALNEGIQAIKRGHMVRIKAAVNHAAESHDALRALIEEAPELFIKPRSVVFHGIKLGYQKGKGKIEWDNADRVVALIRKHFPEQASMLIVTTEKPAKEALNNLTASELKKIGISVVEGDDAVFIKPTDSAVDKMVDALLKDATAEAGAA